MGYDISKESKNNYDLTNEQKDTSLTWDEATMTWDEANGIWNRPGWPLSREQKPTAVSLSNEAKI